MKRLLLILLLHASLVQGTRVIVCGYIMAADGLGKVSVGFMDLLRNDFDVYYAPTRKMSVQRSGIEAGILRIIDKPLLQTTSDVVILTDALWYPDQQAHALIPRGRLNIAYSMFETDTIPSRWIGILNKQFDAVVVPDEFLVPVYQKAGVKKPIFVLPHNIYSLEKMLAMPIKKKRNNIFTFGYSAAFWDRKNHAALLDAFAHEFGNNPHVRLRMHGRFKAENFNFLEKKIAQLGLVNVELSYGKIPENEYITFMASLDCYVSPSKGEGFSIAPREALALGIPCILADNTAQKTICKTGLVCSVPCRRGVPAYYPIFKEHIGHWSECTQKNIRKALKDVFYNYQSYVSQAHQGRQWVKQYLTPALRKKYVTLIAPTYVVLGDENIIHDDFIETTSRVLYDIYTNRGDGKSNKVSK